MLIFFKKKFIKYELEINKKFKWSGGEVWGRVWQVSRGEEGIMKLKTYTVVL